MDDSGELLRGRRLFIFDLDGTLAETSPIHAAAFRQAMAVEGIAVDYATIAGMATAEAIGQLLRNAGLPADAARVAKLVAAKREIALAGLADVCEVQGARAFLAQAAAADKRLAMCTSGARDTITRTLAVLGIADSFDPIITADDVTRAKPAPDGFLAVLNRAGIAAADAVVFEDSDAGIAAAQAAGIDTIRIGAAGASWADVSAAFLRVAA